MLAASRSGLTSWTLALGVMASAGCRGPAGAVADAAGSGDAAGLAEASAGDDARADAATAPADADAPDESPPPECATPEAMRPPGSRCVRRVTGRVADLAGAPLGNAVVSVCGPACWYGRTEADGSFVVRVGEFIPPREYSVQAHGRPAHASLFLLLPTEVPDSGAVAMGEAFALPRYTDAGGEFPEMAASDLEITAGDVTLSIPGGTRLDLDFEDVDLGALGRQLRSTRVPAAQAPSFLRAANPAALWALAPFRLVAHRALGVRVRNPDRAMFAAGGEVEFVALGTTSYPPPVDAGTAVVVGAGRVSADGATIATDPGVGITLVTWIGVRPRR